MKTVLNKLKSIIENLIFYISLFFLFGGIGGFLFCLLLGNQKSLGIFVAMFVIGLVLISLFFYRFKFPSAKELQKKIKYIAYFIELENEKQFYIQRTDFDGSRKDPSIIETRRIYWHNIKDLTFDKTATSLTVLFRNKEELILPKTYDGWYAFIKQVPIETYPSFDRKVVNKLCEQFEACKICSAIAVVDKVCHYCYNDVWEDSEKEEYNWYEEGYEEINYLKEEQLFHFATEEKGAAIDYSVKPFDQTTDWKLLVSEEEILEYSFKNVWSDENASL
jgi:hypothetical protein